jgi:hypothetical protein
VVRVLRDDCREVLRTRPAGSVHAGMTSPPYHRRRPASGIADELGQKRTSERYIKNLVSVCRLRLLVWRARPESR